MQERNKKVRSLMEKKRPSLVDFCVGVAIRHVKYLGDVGEIDLHLLDRILPYCNMDQLKHVEDCTKGRDLSPVTNKLWKKFYDRQFGERSVNEVVGRMRKFNVSFKWFDLYKAKMEAITQKEDEAGNRLRHSYKKEDDKKQSRQIRLCTKVPPSSKRSFFGAGGPGFNLSNMKSNIMKKSKVEYLKSREVQNIAAMKKISAERKTRTSSINGFLGNNSASSSRPTTSTRRRF